MTSFQLTKNIQVVCEAKSTRNGFKHEATLLINGREQDSAKCNYLNRTWESYQYQSVIHKLIDETCALTPRQKTHCKRRADNYDHDTGLGTISAVMALGEVFGNNQKEKNDWKERMMKAGLEGKGLIMPDDWNELDEDEKERRLNGAMETLTT